MKELSKNKLYISPSVLHGIWAFCYGKASLEYRTIVVVSSFYSINSKGCYMKYLCNGKYSFLITGDIHCEIALGHEFDLYL